MKKLKLLFFILLSSALLLGPFSSIVAKAADSSYRWVNANNIDSTNNNSTVTYTFFKKDGDTYKYVYSQPISQAGNNTLNICYQIFVTAKSGKAQLFFKTDPLLDCKTAEYSASNSKNITIDGELPAKIKNNKDLDAGDTNPVDCDANPNDERCKDQEPADKPCFLAIPVFGWILCPILDFANVLYDWMFGIIRNLLFIPEATYNNSEGLKTSWNNMKNIASAIIVLVALVMIAAQIFNFEFISAYTVKKALPRLVIVAIAIQLSWYIFTLLIQITNGVGAGIYNLLTLPFDTGDILNDIGRQNSSVGSGSQAFSGLLALTGLGAGAIATIVMALSPGGWMTLVLVSIGAIVSMLVALITLIVRKMLIITLLVLSPVALALWILPGTQKVWSSWWQLFSKLLLMFPLIMILFAAGQIFASTLANIDESGIVGSVNLIMLVVAFFAPLFLVPATFKAAGGIFGQISGFINGVGKKASGADWGLRRKRDAYRKVSDEIKAQERTTKTREKASQLLSPDSSRFQRLRGRATVGGAALIPGKKGNAALTKYQNLYAAGADDAAAKEAKGEFTNAISGMQFDNGEGEPASRSQVKSAVALATASPGEKVNINGREITSTPHLARAASGFLADTARSDQLRVVQESLEGRGEQGQRLWNTIVNENAGKVAAMNPDQVGKPWHKLDAGQMASMDGASWRNMRASMAEMEQQRLAALSSGDTNRAQSITQDLNTIMATVDVALTSDATKTLVTGEKLRHAKGVVAGPSGWGRTTDSSGGLIDNAGRSPGTPGYKIP